VAAHEILRGVLAGDAVVALPRDELHRREQKSEHDAGAVRGRGGRAQGAGGVTTSRHVSGHGETTVEIRPAAGNPKPDRAFESNAPLRSFFPGGRLLGSFWLKGACACPSRGRAPRMSRVQPARAYDALYGAFVTRATPTRATRGRLTAHRALAHLSLPNVAFADPVYTVSGARDHYREQARVANATETVPVRENMFAEGANYPAHETRCVRTRRPPNSRIHRSPRDARLSYAPYLAHLILTTFPISPPVVPTTTQNAHARLARPRLARLARVPPGDHRGTVVPERIRGRGDRRVDERVFRLGLRRK
jgi:hypothetical protein